tara:strand:+ start:1440 stop:3494 length:2055 start_codon:yes stop_codon:yes gene_type:complete
MALTFKSQIEDLIGTTAEDTSIDQWLQDGAWDIINRVKIVDPMKLQSFAKQEDITNNTASVGDNLILGVYSAASEYREIPPSLKIKALDTDSIHKATTTNPVFWRENGNVYLRPTGGVSNTMSIVKIDTSTLVNGSEFSDVINFPDSHKQLLVLFASMKELQRKMNTQTMPTITLPIVASSPSISGYTTSLPTFKAPSSVVLPSVPSDANVDFTNLGSFPTFNSPIYTIRPFPEIKYNLPEQPIIPITTTASNNMSTWDGSAQSRIIVDQTTLATAPIYNKPIQEPRTPFSSYVSGIELDEPTLVINEQPPVAPTIVSVEVDNSAWVVPEFTSPVMDTPDWGDTNNWITVEEDPEMLASRVQEISTKGAIFSALLADAKAQFDKDNARFQSDVQKSLSDAKLLTDKEGQELSQYGQDVQLYQIKVNNAISEHQQKLTHYLEELKTSFQAWQKEETDKIARFQAESQSELNDFNEDNVEYQAKLQIAIENARLSSSADQILLTKYQNELKAYETKVGSIISENTSVISEWQQEVAANIQKYSADIGKETSKINPDIQKYQIDIDKILKTYQNETGYDIAKYSAEIQSLISKFQQDLASSSADFNEESQRYSHETERIQSDNSTKIAKYQSEIQDYSAEASSLIQDYANKVQSKMAEYKWWEEQYARLKQSYEQGFVPINVQQPKE